MKLSIDVWDRLFGWSSWAGALIAKVELELDEFFELVWLMVELARGRAFDDFLKLFG